MTFAYIFLHDREIRCQIRCQALRFSNSVSGFAVLRTIPISHGEGRFIYSKPILECLLQNGQIATQYVDDKGQPTYDIRYNPNGSIWAVEGITSPDGRILGKMGHSERIGDQVSKNVPGHKDQQLFAAGVGYFK